MSKKTIEPNQDSDPIYTWNKEFKLYKNKDAAAIRDGCKELLKHIKRARYPLKFKEHLIDWCIWKFTTCDFVFSSRGKYPKPGEDDELMGDKYACHYYTQKAWKILVKAKNKSALPYKKLRFDHVWERDGLRNDILKNGTSDEIYNKFVGCVVTKTENDKLTKASKLKLEGWKRYEGKAIFVYCYKKKGTYCKCRVNKNGVFVDCEPIQ